MSVIANLVTARPPNLLQPFSTSAPGSAKGAVFKELLDGLVTPMQSASPSPSLRPTPGWGLPDRGEIAMRLRSDLQGPSTEESDAPPLAATLATEANSIERSSRFGAAPARALGYQFDELGMFGRIRPVSAAAIETPTIDVTAENAVPGAYGTATQAGSFEIQALTGSGIAAVGAALSTGTMSVADAAPPFASRSAGEEAAPLNTAPPPSTLRLLGDEPQTGPGAGAPPRSVIEDRRALDAPWPLHVTLHDDGTIIVVVAAAAGLDASEDARLWRLTQSHAQALGLEVRELRLNGRAATTADRRNPNAN